MDEGGESEMRRGFGLIGALVTVIVLVIVGAIAYNIGWSQGVATHLPEGATNMPGPGYYGYGYGFHPFFAGFGILWFLLILFGLFWLFRLAFFGRRMWGGGGWYGKGWRYGGPQSFEDRAREWHRQEHGEQAPPPGSTPPGSTPPPPDTRSV
jgi:hypothetical protein